MRHSPIKGWSWSPLPEELSQAARSLERELESWRDTPYMDGQRLRGVGCSCLGFVGSVLDTLHTKTTIFKTLPSDGAVHNKRSAIRIMHNMMRAWPMKRARDGILFPGDLLLTGIKGGGPGHIIIVGTNPNSLWQCNPGSKVSEGGLSLIDQTQNLFRVFRPREKHTWS